jgi:hypothetical protein
MRINDVKLALFIVDRDIKQCAVTKTKQCWQVDCVANTCS